MIAKQREYQTVQELLAQRRIDLDELVKTTGVERRIIDAIAHQRYTPSPEHAIDRHAPQPGVARRLVD